MAALPAVLLVVFLADLDVARDPKPPRELPAMAAWVAQHPADWLTASEIADSALDSSLPRRTELWHASYTLAQHLAPRLRNPPAAFVRGGLFHWYELSAADRKAVLDAASPLLRDPALFNDLHRPLFELTHDFHYLLRSAPSSLGALDSLRGIAAANGLFAEYRQTREAMARMRLAQFESSRASLAPHELPALLPWRITTADEPLVRRILVELQQRSFDAAKFGQPTQAMIEYAIQHRLQPLEGLAPFIGAPNVIPDVLRARLALALDRAEAASLIELGSSNAGTAEWVPYQLERARYEARHGNAAAADAHLRHAAVKGLDAAVLATAEECATLLHDEQAAAQFRRQLAATMKQPRVWSGTCGTNELCTSAETQVYSAGIVEIRADAAQSDQIAPYVEIYADDARVAEAAVADTRRFALALPAGVHRIEVQLVNPRIANGAQRRVRLS